MCRPLFYYTDYKKYLVMHKRRKIKFSHKKKMLSHEEQLNEEEYFYFTLLLRESHDIFLSNGDLKRTSQPI